MGVLDRKGTSCYKSSQHLSAREKLFSGTDEHSSIPTRGKRGKEIKGHPGPLSGRGENYPYMQAKKWPYGTNQVHYRESCLKIRKKARVGRTSSTTRGGGLTLKKKKNHHPPSRLRGRSFGQPFSEKDGHPIKSSWDKVKKSLF